MLTYGIKDIYDKDFNKKPSIVINPVVAHQQRDQKRGLEQKKSRIKKNTRMAEIMNMARKNLEAGNVIKVGV